MTNLKFGKWYTSKVEPSNYILLIIYKKDIKKVGYIWRTDSTWRYVENDEDDFDSSFIKEAPDNAEFVYKDFIKNIFAKKKSADIQYLFRR